jgi:hypothetical protein
VLERLNAPDGWHSGRRLPTGDNLLPLFFLFLDYLRSMTSVYSSGSSEGGGLSSRFTPSEVPTALHQNGYAQNVIAHHWIIPPQDLTIDQGPPLGSGAVTVFKAKWNGAAVAVKRLPEGTPAEVRWSSPTILQQRAHS